MTRLALSLALLAGCGGGIEPVDTADTGADTGAPGEPPAYTEGTCDLDTSAATPIAGARLVTDSAYGYGYFGPELSDTPGAVFTDEASYAGFLEQVGSTAAPDAVDFATELAIAVTYYTSGTCGVAIDGWQALDVGGVPHLEVDIRDVSAGCETVCDAIGAVYIVVAVPRHDATTGTFCRSVGGGCE